MPKRRAGTTTESGRLGTTRGSPAGRSRSSSGSAARVSSKRSAAVFTAFVAKETPTTKKIGVIRGGIAARVVDDMVEYLGVPKNVIFGVLHTPESTAHKLIKDDRNLDAAASERVVRVADIARLAEETLGGREAGTQWLKSPNLALGGATPLSMLDTEPGASEVRRILASINYGGAL
jgi:putative toxin-antitoxin system antitoxin component (TIGR02293 family)